MRKTVRAWAALALLPALAAASRAQDPQPIVMSADTNNAVIQGQVVLPSGYAAKRFVKITLRTDRAVLSTLFTNSNGEFQLRNLSEGVYYVQAEVQDESYDPAFGSVALGRGLTARLVLELRDKRTPAAALMRAGPRVISAAELSQQVPAAAKREYEWGLKFVAKGDFAQAAGHFAEAVTLYPEYIAAHNDLGAQYLKLRRLGEAESQFHVVLERDPKNFNAKFNLGLVRVERRDYLDAISQLREAISMDSTRPFARLWLGFALLETGDEAAAEQELTKALIMGGAECTAANYHLARIYLGRGDPAEAARSLRVYLEDAPKGEYAEDARQLQKKIQADAKPNAKPKPKQ